MSADRDHGPTRATHVQAMLEAIYRSAASDRVGAHVWYPSRASLTTPRSLGRSARERGFQ